MSSYKLHTEGRAAMEALLADRANALLAERSRRTKVPPQVLLQQVLQPAQATMKDAHQGVINELLARLAIKDRGG